MLVLETLKVLSGGAGTNTTANNNINDGGDIGRISGGGAGGCNTLGKILGGTGGSRETTHTHEKNLVGVKKTYDYKLLPNN